MKRASAMRAIYFYETSRLFVPFFSTAMLEATFRSYQPNGQSVSLLQIGCGCFVIMSTTAR